MYINSFYDTSYESYFSINEVDLLCTILHIYGSNQGQRVVLSDSTVMTSLIYQDEHFPSIPIYSREMHWTMYLSCYTLPLTVTYESIEIPL